MARDWIFLDRPGLRLIDNWRAILRYAWSIRLMILAGVLSGVEVILPLFPDCCPRGLFAVLSLLTIAGAFVARLVAQKGLSDAPGQPAPWPQAISPRAKRIAAAVAAATALAIPAEGLRQVAYRDPVGVLTVCYGATGQGVQSGKRYTLAECRERLDSDMLKAVEVVEACQPGLPEPVLAAFADAVFNLGPTIACTPAKSSAAHYLKAHDYAAACRQLPRWNKARVAGVAVELPGLTTRRAKEMAVCLEGV